MIPGLRTLVTAAGLAAVLLIIGVVAAPPAPTLQAQSTDTRVPIGWDLTPSGLAAGDRFRLLIATSTTRNARADNIGAYDAHVQSAVASANGHPDIQSYSSGFRVLGSTETVNARDHTETRATDTSAPIYYLNGEKVADDYAGLYDGTGWDSNVPRDESGEEIGEFVLDYLEDSTPSVWTGTNSDGTTHADRYLGAEAGTGSSAVYARPRLTGRELFASTTSGTSQASLYGLSEVFVAPSPPSTDATLSDLELEDASNGSAIALSPGFSSGDFDYSASVEFPVSQVTVIPTKNHAGASIRYLNVDDEELGDGDRFQLFLAEGSEHFIKVEVTAEDDIAKETYTLTVTRAARPGEVLLSEKRLSLTEGGQRSYNVRLDRRPAASVAVTIGGHAGTNVTPNPTSLTFTTLNWNQPRSVGVSAATDANTTNESVTLTHTTTSMDSLFHNITGPSVIVNVDEPDAPDRHIRTITVPSDLPLGDTALPEEEFEVWTGFPFNETIEGVAEGHIWRPSGLWGDPDTDTVWVVDPSHFGIHALKLSALKQGRIERHVAASTSDFDQRLNYRCHFKQGRASGEGNPSLTVMFGRASSDELWIANDSSSTLDSYDRNGDTTAGCYTRNLTSWATNGRSYTAANENFRTPFEFIEEIDVSLGPRTVRGIWANSTRAWLSGPPGGVFTLDLGGSMRMNIAAGYNGHGDSYGLWSDGTTMWVATDSGWLRAYDLNSGVRRAEFDIRIQTHAGMTPGDIWSDGETIWVTNRIGRIDAYRLPGASGGSRTLRATEADPLTASFTLAPEAHDGENGFKLRIDFSDDVEITPEDMRDHALLVSGGTVTDAAMVKDRSDLWELTVEPAGPGPVSILTPLGRACTDAGALCTADGRSLTAGPALVVPGPPADSPSGVPDQPAGTAVFIGGVDLEWNDVPGADSYDVQQYRGGWTDLPADGVEIAFYGAGAIISGLDPEATLWFQVRAVNGHGVSDWSAMMSMSSTSQFKKGRKARPDNAPASGAPDVHGTAHVGESLLADASGIEDGNGLDRVQFRYQWTSNDGSADTDIAGATDSGYTLAADDVGKTIKVRVAFTDRRGYSETRISTATDEVSFAIQQQTANSPATGSPTISGTTQVGETLTADTAGVADDDGLTNAIYSYQWMADGTEIPGATRSSYTLKEDDEGLKIRVWVGFTDDAGTHEALISTATDEVSFAIQQQTANSPATGSPTISGTAQVGETLTADTAGIADDDGLTNVSYGYQWVANDGTTDADIAGATASTYPLVAADEGKTVKVRVTVTDDLGNETTLTSAATNAVEAAAQLDSPATGQPTISGTVQVGETLTADTSGIADDDGLINATFSYQWLADDADIAGATASTYPLVAADEGKTVKVRVTVTDDLGNETTLTSAATNAVEAAAQLDSPATGQPTISGTVQVGETLTADTSGIADDDGLINATFSYQWVANDGTTDADIAGATASTYPLVAADEGKTVKVRVTVTDDLGNETTLTSAATNAVEAAAQLDSPATGAPTITGTAQVGETLTADISGIADADGLTNVSYGYQWVANDGTTDADIAGATASTYPLVAADEGKTVKVRVTVTDDLGNETTLTSAATNAVEAAPEPPATPTGLSATVVSHDAVTLAWDDPEDDSITGYVILRRDRAIHPNGTFVTIAGDTGSTDTTYTDDTVEPDKEYVYRIKAINEHGKVSEMSYWLRTDTPAIPVPDAPTGLSTAVSHDAVTLTWDDPEDDSITGYVILRRDRAIHPNGTFVTIAGDTGSTDTTYTDDTVEPDKRYVYRIKAINEHGEVSERSHWVRANTPN